MKHFAKKFDVNETGRDFVIGDLHGSFSRLISFMEHVSFDPTKDRIFSVGDLIDRGPDSLECLKLKNTSWFHSVYANHEDLMINFLDKQPIGNWWMPNGGNWWNTLTIEEQEEAENLVRIEVPSLITVPLVNGKIFHIIHAEIYSLNELNDESLISDFQEIAEMQCPDGDALIWGRELFINLYDKHLDERTVKKHAKTVELHSLGAFLGPKLSTIYSGHSVMRKPVYIKGQINIDTGAYRSYHPNVSNCYGLTITEPLTGKFWLSNAECVEEIECVKIE